MQPVGQDSNFQYEGLFHFTLSFAQCAQGNQTDCWPHCARKPFIATQSLKALF